MTDLLAYRRTGATPFEVDRLFPSLRLGKFNCIAAVAFGGDGRSLLVRRIDGALRYVRRPGEGRAPAGSSRRCLQPSGEIALEPASDAIHVEVPRRQEAGSEDRARGSGRSRLRHVDEQQDLWWVRIADAAAATAPRQEGAAGGANEGQTSHSMEPLRPRPSASLRLLAIRPRGGSPCSRRAPSRSCRPTPTRTAAAAFRFARSRRPRYSTRTGLWRSSRPAPARVVQEPERHMVGGAFGLDSGVERSSADRVGQPDRHARERDVVAMVNRIGDGSFSTSSRLPANPSAIPCHLTATCCRRKLRRFRLHRAACENAGDERDRRSCASDRDGRPTDRSMTTSTHFRT